jgi:hypothetical protein
MPFQIVDIQPPYYKAQQPRKTINSTVLPLICVAKLRPISCLVTKWSFYGTTNKLHLFLSQHFFYTICLSHCKG